MQDQFRQGLGLIYANKLDNLTISKDVLYDTSRTAQNQLHSHRKKTDSNRHLALKELLVRNEKARSVDRDDLVTIHDSVHYSLDRKQISNPNRTFTKKFGDKYHWKTSFHEKPVISYRSSIDANRSPIETLNNS